jgi:hypothetical protein
MDNLKAWGVRYISYRDVGPTDAVMFDIDDTLIFTNGKANTPIIELLHEARSMGYKIVIITARPGLGPVINWTIKQLGKIWNRVRLFRVYECGDKNSYETTVTLQLHSIRR